MSEDALLLGAQAVGAAQGIELEAVAHAAGASAHAQIAALAGASGVRTRRVLLSGRWHERDNGPILASRKRDGAPLALLRRSLGGRSGYVAAIPGEPPVTVDDTVAETISRDGHVFYRSLGDRTSSLRELVRFALAGQRAVVVRALGWGALLNIVAATIPVGTGFLVDVVIGDHNVTGLLVLALALVGAALGGAAFQLAMGIAAVRIDASVDASTSMALWDRVLTLRANFFRRFTVGDIVARFSVVGDVSRKLSGVALRTFMTAALAVLHVVVLAIYSPSLAAAALGLGVVVLVGTFLLARSTFHEGRTLADRAGRVFGTAVGLVTGVMKLRAGPKAAPTSAGRRSSTTR